MPRPRPVVTNDCIGNAVTLAALTRLYYQDINKAELSGHEASPAYREALDRLTNEKMARLYSPGSVAQSWAIAEKGRAFINHVLALPLPQEVTTWVVPTA